MFGAVSPLEQTVLSEFIYTNLVFSHQKNNAGRKSSQPGIG